MSVSNVPLFTQTPVWSEVQISVANTARDGTGTLGTVFTAGTNGALIDYVLMQAIVTTAAGMIRLFMNDGTNKRLFAEIATNAVTISNTVIGDRHVWAPDNNLPLPVPGTYQILAGTVNAEAWNVVAIGGAY
jgi:hypothetical protein